VRKKCESLKKLLHGMEKVFPSLAPLV